MKTERQQRFLSFSLRDKYVGVMTLEHVQEIFTIDLANICRVPQMPSCVVGVYNWRGEMLWLVDLDLMFGYSPLESQTDLYTKSMVMKLNYESKSLGLLVNEIRDIEHLDLEFIKSPDEHLFSPEMSNFVQGYFIDSNEEILISLDTKAIFQTPMWVGS
ncbi:chemotaxis protein CheW [Pelatocladus sp. BLCC-F211]|uniref:chemotaxis protein CheW n=1 Tax=Pelatocladus sp. BLCC-F211 TaxID=3342752 RepID=UPI0035BB437F